ncbi:MAG: sulfatase-like hydrolase/transferase [Bryobacterales bacterium]
MQRLAFLLLAFAAIASAQKPNIVFILADDMGFGDVQALNPKSKIPTPNLNRLSREGMTFVDAHTGSAVCTPTRYGLVTGRYSWRGSLKKGVLNGYGKPLIEQGRETIGSFLKSQGYYTGIVGKWHLGLGFVRKSNEEDIDFTQGLTDGPHTRGFDFSFIIPASLDFPPYVFIRNGQITRNVTLQSATAFPGFLRNGPKGRDLNPEDALDDLTAEATAYIHERAKHDQPFMLYFPMTAPHKPALPHKRFVGATNLGPYGDFVNQVDWTVGEAFNALDSAGVADNTVVFYSSDNGSYMYHLAPGEKDHVTDATVQGFDETHHTSNGCFAEPRPISGRPVTTCRSSCAGSGSTGRFADGRDHLSDRLLRDCRCDRGRRCPTTPPKELLQPVAANDRQARLEARAGHPPFGQRPVRHSGREVEAGGGQRLRRP